MGVDAGEDVITVTRIGVDAGADAVDIGDGEREEIGDVADDVSVGTDVRIAGEITVYVVEPSAGKTAEAVGESVDTVGLLSDPTSDNRAIRTGRIEHTTTMGFSLFSTHALHFALRILRRIVRSKFWGRFQVT